MRNIGLWLVIGVLAASAGVLIEDTRESLITPTEPPLTIGQKSDMLDALVYIEEDDVSLGPMSWRQAQKVADDYQDAGSVDIIAEGSSDYRVALSKVDPKKSVVAAER